MTSKSAKRSILRRHRNIVFFVYPGIKTLDLVGPLQVFNDTKQHVETGSAYMTSIVSLHGGEIISDTGLTVASESVSRWRRRKVHTFIVVGGDGAQFAADDPNIVDSIKLLSSKSERIASVCTGAFLLARCDLLNGRSAVTHWQSSKALAEMYPKVRVETDPIYINDGEVWTSAGVTAGIDLSLALVSDDLGRETALSLARSLVSYVVRPGGQSQFSTALYFQTRDSSNSFEKLHQWILGNLHQNLSVDALASQANMSSRNFSRLYRVECGTTPAKAVESMRIEFARQLLEGSKYSIAKIAEVSGFKDDERMRRAFIRQLNVSPIDYRNRFRFPSKKLS
ncbi:DJ-1/PfpI family protein [Granulosicoccus sp.]|nr:DJ-1/PfpI family protein [Granulosicoccus sp.]